MKTAFHFLMIIIFIQSCSSKKEVAPMMEDTVVKNHILKCTEYVNSHQKEPSYGIVKKIEDNGGWSKIINEEGDSSEIAEFDINGDAYNDNIAKKYSGGSRFGGRYIEITNGYSKERLAMNDFSSFGDVAYIIPIENSFLLKANEEFKKAALELLVTNSVEDASDPFLNWILLADSDKVREITNSFFNRCINISSNWYNFSIENLYQNSYLELLNYDKNKFSTIEGYEKYSEKYENAWLVSNKFNLGIPSYIGQFNSTLLFSNNHSVYGIKDDLFKFIFINYNTIFDGISKLRWPSIKQAKLVGKYLFIVHELDGLVNDLVVVNLESGDIFYDNQDYNFYLGENDVSNDHSRNTYEDILNKIKK